MPVFTVNDTVTENAGNRSLGDYLLILILRSTDNETQTSVGTVFAFMKTCRTCFVISFFFVSAKTFHVKFIALLYLD